MRQIEAYITNTLQLSLSFITNFFATSTFFGLIEIICPIRHPLLEKAMAWIGLTYTSKNIVILLSALCILLPAFLHRTMLMKKYTLWMLDCRKPNEEEKKYMEKALEIVCEKNNDKKEDYDLYVSEINDYNAFAMGTDTIMITKKLLESTDVTERSIAGLMAHEIGHIHNRHTGISLATSVMSMFGCAIAKIYSGMGDAFYAMTNIPIIGYLMYPVSFLFTIASAMFRYLIRIPETMLNSFNSRKNEYEADKYACEIGMGFWLYAALSYITKEEEELNKFEKLFSAHPETKDRIKIIVNYIRDHNQIPENL